MTKIIKVFFVMLAFLPGLGVSARAEALRVLTTTTDLKSVVEFVGGDKVEVESLGSGKQDYHFLAAKPSYMIKARKADLFVCIGLELEVGYESLILEGSRNRNIQKNSSGYLDASIGIPLLEIPEKVDRSMGDIHAGGNPHYWLDPVRMKTVAGNIARKLSKLRPEHAAYFEKRVGEFFSAIDEKMREWENAWSELRGAKVLTYHRTLVYLADRFGFIPAAELEPKPGVPPSPGHLKKMIDFVRQENVPVILNENIYPDNAARYVAEKTGVRVAVIPISVGGEEGVDDYFLLMDRIIAKIKEVME